MTALLAALLVLLLWVIYWQPRWLIRALAHWRPECTWWSPHGRRVLTIDDVPGPATAEILDILQQSGNRATLFVIGSWVTLETRPLLLRALREGHHLANHGWRDARAGLQSSTELREEIQRCGELLLDLYREAGMPSPPILYYRPGCGLYGPRLARLSEWYPGGRLVLGSLYPHDPQVPCWQINRWHIGRRWGHRDLLILHDRPWTPTLIRHLSRRYCWTSLLGWANR